ncbi:MAG: DUF2029 domain-containing protein [Anaerolineales bacterium]|nr:DUF2029 domain-containing protein [Anaerolineales bacterium]MDW8276731.1 glycosyltransferase family 87 protein [Anaerolineales bacterium]
MKSSPHKWLLPVFALGLFLQLAWHGLLLAQTAGTGEFLKDIDFRIIYTAGQIAREGDWNAIYDLERQRQTQEQITGRPLKLADVLPFNHPPTLLPLQWLLALTRYPMAYLLWAGISAFVSLLNGWLVWRLARGADWPGMPAALLAAQSFLFYPLWVSINKGQDTLFALIGLTVLLLGLQAGRERLSGLGLALLTLRPQFALPLAVPFLFRQRRIWWWFVGMAALLVGYSVLMVGWKGVTDFLHLLTLTSSGETVLIHHADMYNLKGLLLRLLPQMSIETASGISWAAFALVLVCLCAWWARAERVGFQHISLAVTLSLFASPHLHYHDVSFLLIPTLGLLLTLTESNRLTPWQAAFLLLGESLYLAVIHLTPFHKAGVYLLMLGLAVLCVFLIKKDKGQAAHNLNEALERR